MTDYVAANEEWTTLSSFLPSDWKALASTTHALKGLRQDKDPDRLFRTLMLHVGCGYSLRETVIRAREAGFADMSDVALLKRLRKCENWLHALTVGLWQPRRWSNPAKEGPHLNVRLIDATTVKEPGKTGSQWRIHYSLELPSLRCDFFKLTPTQGAGTAEGFWQIPVRAGEYLIADRGYSISQGIVPVVEAGAHVLVRLNHAVVDLRDQRGRSFALLKKLQTLESTGACKGWEVKLRLGHREIEGRICSIRKSQAAIELAQRKLRQEAAKDGGRLQPQTLEFAKWITVFTTFPQAQFPVEVVLEWYRIRWQVELIFKRFKQIVQLGHLPKSDEQSARAWLYGKLIIALLTEKLIHHASALSPWGYEHEGKATKQLA
jgi:hypothetical protein